MERDIIIPAPSAWPATNAATAAAVGNAAAQDAWRGLYVAQEIAESQGMLLPVQPVPGSCTNLGPRDGIEHPITPHQRWMLQHPTATTAILLAVIIAFYLIASYRDQITLWGGA